ncbi:MAG: rane fusion protein heavy metal efflux system [Pseudomonadota bacterium]|nr:rane fusion protein heavy metal efflux system [Pseudomonadota bacterium]
MKLPTTLLMTLFVSLMALTAHAGEGHDHGDAPPAASGNGPRRLPDGSVFLPKPAQRQIGLRTLPVEAGSHLRAFELSGRVVMDPNAGGRVQPMVAGRLTPGPRGLPLPGQTVKKGEVLAYVTPEAGGNSRSLAESRLQRLRELSDTVPRKVIEEAEAAVANEQLRAPVSGVIASANAVSGQVVEAREILFEIVDPQRMMIEALAFDMALASNIAGASIAIGDQKLPLQLVGVARSLREQALPLTFRGEGGALAALAVGQPVKVYVQTRDAIEGVRIPVAALMKNPANQTVVWVKTDPERFVPRVVSTAPLDGTHVAVTNGLQPGDRVVVRAATLVNQVR